jgi:glutamine amidotransferase
MIANTLPEGIVYEHLINLPNSLKNLGYYNYNGWGIAYYNNCKPCALRGASSAYSDQNFNLAVQELAESNAHIAVGHVRLATSGASGIPNPHPFIRNKGSKWWAFGHNGDLSKTALKTLIGPEYLAQNPPTVGHDWDDPDVVDSDLYMLYLLKCIETKGWNATAGIAKAVIDITAVSSGAMNFFLTDGETLWGFCLGNTLYYYYNATFPCYSALASQYPTSAQDGWTELQDYSLVVLTRDDLPYVIDDVTTIPEFPLPTILPVLILITLLAVLMHKKNPLNSAKK